MCLIFRDLTKTDKHYDGAKSIKAFLGNFVKTGLLCPATEAQSVNLPKLRSIEEVATFF